METSGWDIGATDPARTAPTLWIETGDLETGDHEPAGERDGFGKCRHEFCGGSEQPGCGDFPMAAKRREYSVCKWREPDPSFGRDERARSEVPMHPASPLPSLPRSL